MRHNKSMKTSKAEPGAPAGDQPAPTEVEARTEESKGSSISRLKRIEYKLDHLDEVLASIVQRIEDSPENATPEERLSDEVVHRLFDMLQGAKIKAVAAEGATLVDPEQMRYLLNEPLTAVHEKLNDLLERIKRVEARPPGAPSDYAEPEPIPAPRDHKGRMEQLNSVSARLRLYLESTGTKQKEMPGVWQTSRAHRNEFPDLTITTSLISGIANIHVWEHPETGSRYYPAAPRRVAAVSALLREQGF